MTKVTSIVSNTYNKKNRRVRQQHHVGLFEINITLIMEEDVPALNFLLKGLFRMCLAPIMIEILYSPERWTVKATRALLASFSAFPPYWIFGGILELPWVISTNTQSLLEIGYGRPFLWKNFEIKKIAQLTWCASVNKKPLNKISEARSGHLSWKILDRWFFIFTVLSSRKLRKTKLHSSRMHTARLLTVSPSMHCAWGVPAGGGVSAVGVSAVGGVCSWGRGSAPGEGGIPACTEADPPSEQNS